MGAGPAGSTAAYHLAREGIEVELIDKTEFPRDKPCAGGLFNPFLFYREFPYLEELDLNNIILSIIIPLKEIMDYYKYGVR